jgi:hypothetical protein
VYQLDTSPPNFNLLARIEERASETFLEVSTNGDFLACGYSSSEDGGTFTEMPTCFLLKPVRAPGSSTPWHTNILLADLDVRVTNVHAATLFLLTFSKLARRCLSRRYCNPTPERTPALLRLEQICHIRPSKDRSSAIKAYLN